MAGYSDDMSRTIPAIFDAGVFRPLQPVDLAEGTQVEVQVPTLPTIAAPELSPEELDRQRADVAEWLAEIESLPPEGPDDGFSGRDHDKILYGKP
jgi:predicted DNA-binding antitoxin AbrB/MazE fold protein